MLNSVSKHIERLPKRQISHDIKGEKVEPICDIHWLFVMFLNLCEKLLCIIDNARLIVMQG